MHLCVCINSNIANPCLNRQMGILIIGDNRLTVVSLLGRRHDYAAAFAFTNVK